MENITWLAIDRAEKSIDRMAEENREGFAESRRLMNEGAAESRRLMNEGMAEMRLEMAIRDRAADERVEKLVKAISELIQRMDGRNT
jgi:hypothetical protein